MKMKQWICPGVTRKKYLELCMDSLVLVDTPTVKDYGILGSATAAYEAEGLT